VTRERLASLIVENRWNEIEASVRILWLMQIAEKREDVTATEIVKFFVDEALSVPNGSRLKARLILDRRVLHDKRTNVLRLRASAISELNDELGTSLEAEKPTSTFIAALETHAARIKGIQTRSFVQEAIKCAKNDTPRAAIIMSWCGAISSMQEFTFEKHLDAFNIDAVKNGLLKGPAKTLADMRDISKESLFLESLARVSILDNASKRALKRCLDRRNDVGHPSEVKLSDAAVADHFETLMLNVFERFSAS